MFSFRLLGVPQILHDGAAIDLPRRRTRALVYYLAAQPGPVLRDHVLGLLWPDHERQSAQQILRTTLHSARRVLGAALISSDESLAISPTVTVDVRVLAALTAADDPDEAALRQALEQYQDEFLTGFVLADSEPFSDWLAGERERMRLLAVRGLMHLARPSELRGDFRAALTALGRALSFDPLQEDLQRTAIRLHYLAGDRVGAIRRFEHVRDLLDAEMGVPPMAETQALYDAIITDTLPVDPLQAAPAAAVALLRPAVALPLAPRTPPAAHPELPFVGRDAEFARLVAACAAGRFALIEGVAGIGKSRLAGEYLSLHQGLILSGTAHELEQSLPYQPIVSALRGLIGSPDWPAIRSALAIEAIWMAEAARLLPELSAPNATPPVVGRPDEARLWEAVTRLLTAIAALHPVALLIDDLQWADASTLGLLGYLLRRGGNASVQLIATARPVVPRSPLATLIADLTRESRLERISLGPLSHAATEALAQQLSPLFGPPLAHWLEHNAEGNPYILAELVRHARSSGLLREGGTLDLGALSAAPVVPASVYNLIEARLSRLSEAARRVLDAGVAVGREFEFDLVARAAAISEGAALDALDELRAARLIAPLPDGQYRFDHSLTMEVAYRETGEPRHRLLHRRVAEALESLHRDRLDDMAGLIASHLAEGGAPDRAARYALRAARRAASVAAWAEAAAFYEQAISGLPPSERSAALLELGDIYLQSGEAARAAEQYRTVREQSRDRRQVLIAQLALARALLPQGRYSEMIALVRPLTSDDDPHIVALAHFQWGTALSLEGADLADAAAHLRTSEELTAAQPNPDPAALAQVRFELGSVAAQQGDLLRAVGYYHEALTVADFAIDARTSPDSALNWRILARNNLAYHLHLLGDLDTATRYIGESLRLAEEYGAISLQPYLYSTSGEIALARGDLESAEEAFTSGYNLAVRLDIPERLAGLSANLGLVAIRRGQQSLAVHRLSAALAKADALGIQHLAAQVRIWLAALLPPAEARELLAAARVIAEGSGRRRLLDAISAAEQSLDAPQPAL